MLIICKQKNEKGINHPLSSNNARRDRWGASSANTVHIGWKEGLRPTGLKSIVIATICILALLMSMATVAVPIESAAGGSLGVSGTQITLNGAPIEDTLKGVVDTTALQYSLEAWVNGEIATAGKNQNFPSPVSRIPTTSLDDFWETYFAYCQHFDLQLVRLGASDNWGSEVLYTAWLDHRENFYRVMDTMAEKAADHGVFVILVLAGTQDYPAYDFGGQGNPFDTGSAAYSNYLTYARDVMAHLAPQRGIGMYDLWNEPDADKVDQKYWKGDKVAFSAWATRVAQDTSGQAFHPRTMGVAGFGRLFDWGQADFDLATGQVPFEVAHRHYYASVYDPRSARDPEIWAEKAGKPLLWGEVGNNGQLIQTRWPLMEEQISEKGGEAICSIAMIGTDGYPYHSSGVSWMLHSISVPVSEDLTPSVYPVIHPIDESISNAIGGSWAVVMFFMATWLAGCMAVNRGRNLILFTLVGAMFILSILVFIARV